ncbi:MAG: hypothetical protein AAB648_00985 [Patescibacteria group bacterium]
MRKSTKVILIALVLLIVPAIYLGYLLYRESKIVDLVSVEVVDSADQKLSGITVSLFPQWEDKKLPVSFNEFTKNGVAEFHNLPPGWYQIVLSKKTGCDRFKINIQGVKFYIKMPFDDCSITIIETPK